MKYLFAAIMFVFVFIGVAIWTFNIKSAFEEGLFFFDTIINNDI